MKKTLTILYIFICFLILYFLQSNFFNWFTIAGVKPNLFIILIIIIGLFIGKKIGFTLGVCFGILLDIFIGNVIGTSAICFGILGFLSGYIEKNISKESRITIMLIVLGGTIIFEFGAYLLDRLIIQTPMELVGFIKILVIEVIYNLLLIIIFYKLLTNGGYIIESVFKKDNIMTKYL